MKITDEQKQEVINVIEKMRDNIKEDLQAYDDMLIELKNGNCDDRFLSFLFGLVAISGLSSDDYEDSDNSDRGSTNRIVN